MKLLNTTASNTKIAKSIKQAGGKVRIASLSMYPDDTICPARHLAGCATPCLVSAGRGRYSNVVQSRKAKSMLWSNDRELFVTKLRQEIHSFIKLCQRQGVQPIFRLNTISDIPWEDYLDMEGEFGAGFFYDYTKLSKRLTKKLPRNYKLMFSFSAKPEFAKQVSQAIDTRVPMTVVFRGGLPSTFMGRPVIDGDISDIDNVNAGEVVVGLRAKGKAVKELDNPFIVDNPECIARV